MRFGSLFLLTPVLLGLLLGLILGKRAGCATTQPVSLDLAQTIALEAWHSEQHIVWEIDWPAAPVGGPLTVEAWRAGGNYRLEILEAVAPALIGEILVFNGQTARQFNRFSPEPPLTLASPRLSPVTDAFTVIDQLLATPPQTAGQTFGQTIHGPAQKITLSFVNNDRLMLWRDEETGLPGQVIFLVEGKKGELKARSFEPLFDPPQALFE
ncbi:MAG: hypothetical protein JW953_12075 [Anaerolineae bacterium]|nr:hypothetical protein [Anaerolineae bacterium]